MINVLRRFKFPGVVAFVVATVWFAAWERSVTAKASVGYLPPPPRLAHIPVVEVSSLTDAAP
jgi:hypothetical protein